LEASPIKAFLSVRTIALASVCLAVVIYLRGVPAIELKPGSLFAPANAMEKGSPAGSGTRKHIGQPKYEDLKKTTKPSTGSTSGSSPTRLQK
jgi:hypothetical protein